MATAEDSVLKYMADNPGASITEISDAIVAFGADLDTVADMAGVSRADARAAFTPTPAPAPVLTIDPEVQDIVDQLNAGTIDIGTLEETYNVPAAEIQTNWDAINKQNNYVPPVAASSSDSDDGFDIMEALDLVGNINPSLSGASSFPVNQSPVIMNATPAGVGPNSEYALSATDNTANEASTGDLLGTAGTTYSTIGNVNKAKQGLALIEQSKTVSDATEAAFMAKAGEDLFVGGVSSIVAAAG